MKYYNIFLFLLLLSIAELSFCQSSQVDSLKAVLESSEEDTSKVNTIYLFTDGFIDQKGGKGNKKYMSKNFKDFLLEIHDQPMQDQKEILDKTLLDWMGDNSQMDDVLVIGVRV